MPTKPRKARKTGRTPEERAAEAQALHDRLAAEVEALAETDAWFRFLEFSRSFHAYSLNNLLLILAQCPEATAVAGFRQWQAKGRQVRKGERSLKIFGYSTKTVTEPDPDTGEETTRRLPRFPMLSVFDISQTDPIEGAETVENPVQRLTGEGPAGVWDTVAAWLAAEGWTLTRQPIAGDTNGYTDLKARAVVVRDDVDDAQAVKTLIHEAAHVILHVELEPGEYVEHRGIWETEAESVAYVVAGLAGLDTSAYSVGYVAHWSATDSGGGLDTIRATAARVLAAVHTIAEVLDPTGDEETANGGNDMEAMTALHACSHGHPFGCLDNCDACDVEAGWWVGVSCRFCRRYEAHVRNLTTYGHTTRCPERATRPAPEPRDLLELLALGGAS